MIYIKDMNRFIQEDMNMTINVNPNINVQGMGDVTMNSGDLGTAEIDSDIEKHKKKRKKLIFIKDIPNFYVNEIK